MKKIILLLTVCLTVFGAIAQKYDPIKNMLIINQFEKAKGDFDKAMTNAKFAANAEAYILKTAIYAGLATHAPAKNTPEGEKLANEATEAFKKYQEMDPEMSLALDPIYQQGPISLYSSFYSEGYNHYNDKKWQEGFEKLKTAVYMSDVLLKLKILTVPIDTNVLVLAGITAEKSENNEEASKYYGRLADQKIAEDDYVSIYQFLVRHYLGKKDIPSFEKYKKLGGELYPKNEFFNYDRVDFAVGLAESFMEKTIAIKEILAVDPTNFKANQIMGEIIYDTLNSDADGAVLPANADELEKTMVSSFLKAAAAKPDFEIPYIYMGDHFINKAVSVNEARTAHAVDMKARTKPGTMASKEDVAKRELLDKQYGEQLVEAKEPYEKTVAILSARAKKDNGLEIREKEQYKKAVNYLAEIAMFKKIESKSKPAESAKFAADEKKWNELYDSINAIPTLKKEH